MTNSIWRVTRDCILRLSEWVQPIKRKQTKQYAEYLPQTFFLPLPLPSSSLVFTHSLYIFIFYLFATCKNFTSRNSHEWASARVHSTSVQQIYLRHKLYEQAIKIFHKIPFSHQVSKNKQMIKMNIVVVVVVGKKSNRETKSSTWMGKSSFGIGRKNIYNTLTHK